MLVTVIPGSEQKGEILENAPSSTIRRANLYLESMPRGHLEPPPRATTMTSDILEHPSASSIYASPIISSSIVINTSSRGPLAASKSQV